MSLLDPFRDQLTLLLETAYGLGRDHRFREDELIRHNNAQLEENREQRRTLKQYEAMLRRMRIKLQHSVLDLDIDTGAGLLVREALEISATVPKAEDYDFQEQVEALAGTILTTHGFEGVAYHDRMVGLTEAISLFLRDEIGV